MDDRCQDSQLKPKKQNYNYANKASDVTGGEDCLGELLKLGNISSHKVDVCSACCYTGSMEKRRDLIQESMRIHSISTRCGN
jgi:hypothetical protein